MRQLGKLVQEVSAFYKKEGRSHLPWRKTRDPYKILVSEVMLQQTQVDRVLPKYKSFIKEFPTAKVLAQAPLSKVLAAWQGLGYNRRAKYLQQAAQVLAKEKYTGQRLPGVGPYTRGAVLAFAYNQPEVFIETNIRTVFIHLCSSYKGTTFVKDAELLVLVGKALPLAQKRGLGPREWYWALMDYGSFLKKSGVRNNSRSAHYAKQSKFEGSGRQLRGAILRELLKKPASVSTLTKNVSRAKIEVTRELTKLEKEKLIKSHNKIYSIAE